MNTSQAAVGEKVEADLANGYPEKEADEAQGLRFRNAWLLEPDGVHLNHGSTGAVPRRVHEAQVEWILRVQRNPAHYYVNQAKDELTDALEGMAEFVGAQAKNLSFVMNATFGINLAMHSLRFEPGDEILVTDHDYWVVIDSLKHYAQLSGATVKVCRIPLPVTTPEALADFISSQFTARTKLFLFPHISSQTSLIFPVKELCQRAKEKGIPVCVDGAHALGVLPLDVESLDCDFYAASCHKWLSGPLGSGFLYVHPRAQDAMRPIAVGKSIWKFKGRMTPTWQALTWMGTSDPAPFLALGDAIAFQRSAELNETRARMHRLARYARARMSALTGLPGISPDHPDWYGAMVSLRLPKGTGMDLRIRLRDDFGIHVPVFERADGLLLRISCPMYTRPSDIERLIEALEKCL